jgi:hypothetical protein
MKKDDVWQLKKSTKFSGNDSSRDIIAHWDKLKYTT